MEKEIYLAGGCFWGLQKYLSIQKGIIETEAGYINGLSNKTNYEKVCMGSGHAEVVYVLYDPHTISLTHLLELYYKVIDPTSFHKQGNDKGVQYRTGIYYTDPKDLDTIRKSIQALKKKYTKEIQIEVEPVQNFSKAEEYHQNYLDKNPYGYCHIPKELLKKDR